MLKFSGPAKRMWVNQPSALQPCHRMHGCRVLAIMSTWTDSSVRVYFADGPIISAEVSPLSLSCGWPEISRFDKVWLPRNTHRAGATPGGIRVPRAVTKGSLILRGLRRMFGSRDWKEVGNAAK